MNSEVTPEEEKVIADFYTEEEWNKVSEFEKADIYATLKRYLIFKDYKGVNIPPPDFMIKRKRLNNNSTSKQSPDKTEDVSLNDGKSTEEKSVQQYDYQNASSSKENDDHNQPQQKPQKKSNGKGEEHPEVPPKKYPKRSVPAKNYHEPEEPKDDRYVYCDNCEEDCVDYCKTCGKLSFLKDYPVRMNTADRARKTCPKGVLIVRPSNIHGLGVFALKWLPKGVQMGPYEGQAAKQESKSGYAWKLRDGKLIDAANERNSNYLRYVNCARNSDEQNLVAFQYDGKLFYRTCKNIGAGEELLVYYGHSFAKTLGIDPKRFYEPNTSKVKNYYPCKHCHIGLSTEQFKAAHQLRCKYNPNRMITFDVNKAVTCQYCCRCFEKVEDLEEHEKRCRYHRKKTAVHSCGEEMKQFRCSECPYVTKYAKDLKRHGITHSKEGRERFRCSQCTFTTYYKDSLIKHISRLHSSSSSKFCYEGCKRIFLSKNMLDSHILKMHPSLIGSVSSKIRACLECKYKTTHKANFTRHMLTHSKENAQYFQCSACQYKTYDKSLI
ncbi:unnamed protein product [Callosobruchus maculatus]|uniref:SET domain-containing protein n=1 Tax=Callosobruchus maculatus TaxID=64391 RepID=A0A653C1D4_CALMS|nr:unnamed protein product [Callosobruchus maculatus]